MNGRRVALALAGLVLACLVLLHFLRRGAEPLAPSAQPEAAGRPVAPAQGVQRRAALVADDAGDPPPQEEPLQALADERPTPALLARQDELEADQDYHAVCNLQPALAEAQAYLAVGDPSQFNGRRVPVVLGRAFLPILEEGPGAGLLTVEGFAPLEIRWLAAHGGQPGGCQPDPLLLQPGGTVITGRVTHEDSGDPASRAWVEGCGGLANADEDGAYYMEVVPGPCTVMAMRQDGQLRTLSQPVEIVAEEGRDLVLDLELPGFRRAGLGIRIKSVEGGFLVEEVLPGAGAEAAGLQAGDLVVAVDGEPASELDLGSFVQAVGGQEGTEVSLTIESGGQRREQVVERKPVQ